MTAEEAGASPAAQPLAEVRLADPHNPEPITDVPAEGIWVGDVLDQAPEPAAGDKPAVARIHSGDRANHILFTFSPGQQLRRHSCVHPITVTCPQGSLEFAIDGHPTVTLTGSTVVHVPARVHHSVSAGEDDAVLWLTMHTND